MSYIIVTRNPYNGRLWIIADDQEAYTPSEFATKEAAEEVAAKQTLCRAWGYELLEVTS